MLSRLFPLCLPLCLTTNLAYAQALPPAPEEPGFAGNLWTRGNLLGDAGGLRTTLWNYGITFGLQDINEVWGNVSGGIRRGGSYDGLTIMSVGLDTQRAFGLEGGTLNVSALQIRGRSISADNLLNLQTVSGILATPTTRLWEAWYQQSFLDGAFDVKLGQQSVDTEFLVSQYSGLFLNTAMGWPALPSANLYAGGPAYPLSSLGIRLRTQLGNGFTGLIGAYQDNPPGGPFDDDSQLRGSTRWGGNFNLRTGALFLAEIQYAFNQPSNGDMDYGKGTGGLPGTYKLGMWYDTAGFPDQRFDTIGLSLADPASTGVAMLRRNNFSFYAVADQMIWRPADDSPQSIGVFARVMGGPGDRNLVNFSVNAGISMKAPLPGRDDDTVGIGFGIAKFSNGAAAQDRDVAFFSGASYPVRGSETFVELTYQIQATGWWQLQPDFQFVLNPSGGIQNPTNPAKRVGNEAIFGLRSIVTF